MPTPRLSEPARKGIIILIGFGLILAVLIAVTSL